MKIPLKIWLRFKNWKVIRSTNWLMWVKSNKNFKTCLCFYNKFKNFSIVFFKMERIFVTCFLYVFLISFSFLWYLSSLSQNSAYFVDIIPVHCFSTNVSACCWKKIVRKNRKIVIEMIICMKKKTWNVNIFVIFKQQYIHRKANKISFAALITIKFLKF